MLRQGIINIFPFSETCINIPSRQQKEKSKINVFIIITTVSKMNKLDELFPSTVTTKILNFFILFFIFNTFSLKIFFVRKRTLSSANQIVQTTNSWHNKDYIQSKNLKTLAASQFTVIFSLEFVKLVFSRFFC
jgi:hypothetical protein